MNSNSIEKYYFVLFNFNSSQHLILVLTTRRRVVRYQFLTSPPRLPPHPSPQTHPRKKRWETTCCQLRTRRVLNLFKAVLLRTRRMLKLFLIKMFHWESEGCYHCTKSMTIIVPFWFLTEHCWMALMPFWLSADDVSVPGLGLITFCVHS